MKHMKERRDDERIFSWRFLFETAKVVIISLAIILPIRYFLVQPFYVKGASMEPTFHDHQYLLIDEVTYRFREPARGDIVVFRYPNDPSQFFIKRIVGLPNETVTVEAGRVTITSPNAAPIVLDESSYFDGQTAGSVRLELASDEYYLLGDNRSASLDSRSFGPVERRYIVGRTWLRAWPFSTWTTFTAPDYSM